MSTSFWASIDKVIYINLDKRKDRNKHILNELNEIGVPEDKFEKLSAIEHQKGYIGCSLSHIKCLKLAIERNYNNVMIIEDDIVFKDKAYFKLISDKIIEQKFDVFLLGVNIKKYKTYNSDFIQILKGLTTTGYIVKNHYFNILLENYEKGLEMLIKTDSTGDYAVDTFTHNLQSKDLWMSFDYLNVSQLPCYSDIMIQNVNYDYWMLNKIKREYYNESI